MMMVAHHSPQTPMDITQKTKSRVGLKLFTVMLGVFVVSLASFAVASYFQYDREARNASLVTPTPTNAQTPFSIILPPSTPGVLKANQGEVVKLLVGETAEFALAAGGKRIVTLASTVEVPNPSTPCQELWPMKANLKVRDLNGSGNETHSANPSISPCEFGFIVDIQKIASGFAVLTAPYLTEE